MKAQILNVAMKLCQWLAENQSAGGVNGENGCRCNGENAKLSIIKAK
jgi:hypothetical protein